MDRHWIQEYEENYKLYQETLETTRLRLQELLRHECFHLHVIDARVKTRCSLENKLKRQRGKYRQLADVTDICGIRIITYYADEIDAIAECIRSGFPLDVKNCVDKRALLDANSFGYLSLHLILDLPCDHNEKLACCKVEVQIRSVLQHAWAAVEHELAYKNKEMESYELRRSFSRLSGMLESVDLEFLRIRHLVAKAKFPEERQNTFAIYAGRKQINRMMPACWKSRRLLSFGSVCAIWVSAVFFILTTLYCGSKAMALVTQLSSLLRNV